MKRKAVNKDYENLSVEQKILKGHIARVQRRVEKIMKNQFEIRKQMYKLDNKISSFLLDVTQDDKVDTQESDSIQLVFHEKLSKLVEEKQKNNELLKLQEKKLQEYRARLSDVTDLELIETYQ